MKLSEKYQKAEEKTDSVLRKLSDFLDDWADSPYSVLIALIVLVGIVVLYFAW